MMLWNGKTTQLPQQIGGPDWENFEEGRWIQPPKPSKIFHTRYDAWSLTPNSYVGA